MLRGVPARKVPLLFVIIATRLKLSLACTRPYPVRHLPTPRLQHSWFPRSPCRRRTRRLSKVSSRIITSHCLVNASQSVGRTVGEEASLDNQPSRALQMPTTATIKVRARISRGLPARSAIRASGLMDHGAIVHNPCRGGRARHLTTRTATSPHHPVRTSLSRGQSRSVQ
jgi:hypothetical protein